jgi:micrococcal nuclease
MTASNQVHVTKILELASLTTAVILLIGCGSKETKNDNNPGGREWSLERVVDGDTIEVLDSNAKIWDVRLIGIDTPERGQCGFDDASAELERLLTSGPLALTGGANSDTDKYDRLLRYVEVGGVDVGLELIKSGHAVARYDSRDGYGAHLRELSYIDADANSPNLCNQ